MLRYQGRRGEILSCYTNTCSRTAAVLVLRQWSGHAHHRGGLSGEGRSMLRDRTNSKEALSGRNNSDADAVINVANANATGPATSAFTNPNSAAHFDSAPG
jgi:hypothetical protein